MERTLRLQGEISWTKEDVQMALQRYEKWAERKKQLGWDEEWMESWKEDWVRFWLIGQWEGLHSEEIQVAEKMLSAGIEVVAISKFTGLTERQIRAL